MINKKIEKLFGVPRRTEDSKTEQIHLDIGASAQLVLEEILLKMARNVHEKTKLKNLCLGGGEPTGACCDDEGICTLKTEAECIAAGGTWKGAETVCDPNPCIGGSCGGCSENTPAEIGVVISGMQAGWCASGCLILNDSYVLAQCPDVYCRWKYDFSPPFSCDGPPYGATTIYGVAAALGAGQITIDLRTTSGDPCTTFTGQTRWQGSVPSDCMSWSNVSIPIKNAGFHCQATAACLLSAL